MTAEPRRARRCAALARPIRLVTLPGPGINVFIGENGTGKSHVLKMLYAALKGVRDQAVDKTEAERWQRERLAKIFNVGGGDVSAVGHLVRQRKEDEGASLWVAAGQEAETKLKIERGGDLVLAEQRWPTRPDALLLPWSFFDESYRDA